MTSKNGLEGLLPEKAYSYLPTDPRYEKEPAEVEEAYNDAIDHCLQALKGKVILVEDIDEGNLLDIIASPFNWVGLTESAQCKHIAQSMHKYLKGLSQ